jgi:hypothetical protein
MADKKPDVPNTIKTNSINETKYNIFRKKRIRDIAFEQEYFAATLRSWLDQIGNALQMKPTKDFIEVIILEPFTKFVFNRLFPYIIITSALFIAIFLFAMLTFIMLFRNNTVVNTPEKTIVEIFKNIQAGKSACPFCCFSVTS